MNVWQITTNSRQKICQSHMFISSSLKNCLFDDGVFDLREFIRKGASNDDLKKLFLSLVKDKPANGFIAEANRKNGDVSESMSTIGG